MQRTQNICMSFVQRRPNVFDINPTLYKCYTNVSGWAFLSCYGPHASSRPNSQIQSGMVSNNGNVQSYKAVTA